MFLLYVNDFHLCLRSAETFHFADDTTILVHARSVKEIKKAMRSLLNTILDWLAANRLTLNAKKTEIVLFRSKSKLCDTRFTIKIKGHKIYPSNKVKYLGVFLDPHLEWKHQVTELAKKLSIAVGLL